MTLIALTSGLIYLLVFTLPFPLPRLYATIPPVDYTKLTHYSASGLLLYGLALAALFALYLWAIRLTQPAPAAPAQSPDKFSLAKSPSRQDFKLIASFAPPRLGERFLAWLHLADARPTAPFLLTTSTLLAFASLFAYPLTAIDLFIYAIRSRGWALYGLNPLATAPELLPAQDPWLGLAAEWVDAPSPYGPVWEWLSLGAFHLSGGGFLAHLLVLKLIALLAYVGCVWLVYAILRRLRPAWAAVGTIALAWNPLVLLESVQNGHNDILMTLFLLAAVWAYIGMTHPKKQESKVHFGFLFFRVGLICLLLALSVLVKFVTVITVPFFLIALAASQATGPRRLALAGLSGLAIALLVWLPLWPLWPGWANWAVLQAGNQAGRSLLALLVLGLRGWLGTNPAFDLSRNFLLFIFTLIYLTYLWRSLKTAFAPHSPTPPPPCSPAPLLLSPLFFPLFWYVLLAAPVFHAWYLLWFLPLAGLLLPDRRALNAAITFSITALLVIPYFETVRVWYPLLLQNQFLGHLIGVPLLLLPPAVAALWPISPSHKSEV